jgi:hypothetical protein
MTCRISHLLVPVCVLTALLVAIPPCLADNLDESAASGGDGTLLRVDSLEALYGSCGSKRAATFFAGEQMYFRATVSGISTGPNGDCDYDCTYSLVDSAGKAVPNCSGVVQNRDVLVLGGSVSAVFFSATTDWHAPPGKYTLKCVLHDRRGRQTAVRDQTISLRDLGTVGIVVPRLSYNRQGVLGSRAVFTLGQPIYVSCRVSVPRNKEKGVVSQVAAAILDEGDRVVREWEAAKQSVGSVNGGGVQYCYQVTAAIARPGRFRVRIEAKDLSTNDVAKCDMPLIIEPPPKTPASPAGAVATVSRSLMRNDVLDEDRPLSIDAFPTLGELGCPRAPDFVLGEKAFFLVTLRGLSHRADKKVDCTMRLSILDSQSTIRVDENVEIPKVSLFPKGAVTTVLWWQSGPSTPPGRYKAKIAVTDNVTAKNVTKDIPVSVADNDTFTLACLDLSADHAGKVSTGPNLTVGETVYARCGVFLPRKSGGHDVEVTASFLDANRKELGRLAPYVMKKVFSAASYPSTNIFPTCSQAFTPNRPGSYFLRLELKDLATQETVVREMPFSVFSSPEFEALRGGVRNVSGVNSTSTEHTSRRFPFP